jgi:hypothetical protein
MATTRVPGGFPHLTFAFSTLVLVGLAAFTLAALMNESPHLLLVLAIAIPALILVLVRSADYRISK